jgi:hypothetical protein
MEATRQGPTDGMSHWSSYRLAKKLGLSQSQRQPWPRHSKLVVSLLVSLDLLFTTDPQPDGRLVRD